jgi:hypothetical protein
VFSESTRSKFFADDAKVYSEIRNQGDLENFQENLTKLSIYAETWQLSISIKKCCTTDITANNRHKSHLSNTVNNTEISAVEQIRDLGVIVDSKLKFSAHIAKIVSTAKQCVALIFRAFLTRDVKLLIIAFKAYILPLIEFCSPVWSPHSVHDILLLESVQRRYTKRIPGLENLSYNARLKFLNLSTLELRRLHFDLIFCYKLLNGHIAGLPENYGLILSNRKSRGNSLKLAINVSRIDARKHFFASRIFEPWNSLPDDVVLVDSVKSFKRQLSSIDLNKFLIFKSV